MSASLVVTALVRLALMVLVAAATTLMPAADAGAQALVVGANFVIKSLDPARTVETTSNMVNHSVYDSLVTFDGEDLTTPKPSLATDWTVSPDGKTYTFRLRRNVRFASGNPLTSADVKWSLDRVRYVKSNPAFFLNSVEDILAPDPFTVVLKLKAPNPSLLPILSSSSLGAIDSKLVSQKGGDASPDAKDKDKAEPFLLAQSAGTGAYVMERYVPDQEVVLVRNPNHWRGAAKVERIVIRNITEPATQKLQLERGRPRHRDRARPGPDAGAPQRVRGHRQGESGRHDLLRPDERQPADRRPVRPPQGPAGGAVRPRLRRHPGAGRAGRRPAGRDHPHGLRGRARSAPGRPHRPRPGPRPPEGSEPGRGEGRPHLRERLDDLRRPDEPARPEDPGRPRRGRHRDRPERAAPRDRAPALPGREEPGRRVELGGRLPRRAELPRVRAGADGREARRLAAGGEPGGAGAGPDRGRRRDRSGIRRRAPPSTGSSTSGWPRSGPTRRSSSRRCPMPSAPTCRA